jgi:aspartate aminotransferase-like enzyme
MPPSSSNVDADSLRVEIRKRFGIRLAGGQEKWKGKIVRVGHMGFVDPFEIVNVITAIGLTLTKLGAVVPTTLAVSEVIKELEAHVS